MAEHEAKMAARAAKTAATGKKPGGKAPQPPPEGPLPSDQVNLTDEDLRIMPVADGGFDQGYNAQAAVATTSRLVVATDVVQAPNDKNQVEPDLGIVEGGLVDPALQIVGNQQLRRAAEKAEHAHVGAGPVRQRLRPGRLGIGEV